MQDKKVVKSKFKKILIIYSCVISIIMIGFLIHVFDSLVKYEKNQTDKYVLNTLNNVCKKGVCNIENLTLVQKSNFDKDIKVEDALESLIKNADLKVEEKLNSDEFEPTFEVKLNDNVILEVNLQSKKKLNRLGLLSFHIWQNAKVVSKFQNGFYTYNIDVPSNYKVYVNDLELTKTEIKESQTNEAMTEMNKYVNIPYLVKYEVNNLYREPDIKILDENNKEISYEKKGNTISKNVEFKIIETKEEASNVVLNMPDILNIAETWSLFMTNDLQGNLHGIDQVNKFLINDSSLHKFAKKWIIGPDIDWISKHTFDNPKFSNEQVKDFEIYNENAFSCVVYLEKNMIINENSVVGRRKHQDIMHERLYFVKKNNEWKLVNMQAITERP